jgi:hypothetical protein
MSYQLERTEEDAEVKKAVDEAQEYYDAQDKREWVEWAGKTLMPRLHAQIAMEKADKIRAEREQLEETRQQDEREQQEREQLEDMRRQDEREQRERERAEKEAELDEKEEEYIQQMNAKEINEKQFRELIDELDLERGMAFSVAEGPAMTQDEEVGEKSSWRGNRQQQRKRSSRQPLERGRGRRRPQGQRCTQRWVSR